ncbi:TlpA family protein disulfide reductase [Methylocystis rosea]|uniref:TlpA family protein disulfide reductase n=1 Tax=Methylocystis rosea TaxID=173366 RepID=UPI001FE0AE2B|nr:TlpA disulfide reductase family protein [Methylocystis rosea]
MSLATRAPRVIGNPEAINGAGFITLDSRSGLRPTGNDKNYRSLVGLRRMRLMSFAVVIALLAGGGAFAMDFKPYGRGAFGQLTKAHAGRPLIVHFWSVTCPPCLVELPQWAKIAAEKKGSDIVFVNTDSDDDRARAEARIEKAGLSGADHYGFADDFVEKLYFEADSAWRGELPFTALVAPDGGVVTVTGAVDDPLIVDWLKKHVAK